MRGLSIVTGVTSLLGLGKRQEATAKYCDSLGRCFSSWTNDHGITYGIAIPVTKTAPYDTILQITAPVNVGWVALAWGGAMTNNPLAVAWADGKNVRVASRMAFGYSSPPPFDQATYTLLGGSYANATHLVATVVCSGCSAWDPFGIGGGELSPTGRNEVAWAYSNTPVNDPSDINTTINFHNEVGHVTVDFNSAQSPNFSKWVSGSSYDPVPAKREDEVSAQALPIPTSCSLTSRFPLQVASGWRVVKLKASLTTPRGVVVDTLGNILVVEVGKGVTAHTLGSNGCISTSKTLISLPPLNHGIALSPDGRKLVVSSLTTAWRYDYDPNSQTATNQQVIIKGMENGGHPTRTTVIPPGTPDLLIVSQGSRDNIDMPSQDKSVGRALVKVFNLTSVPSGGWDYRTQGYFLGVGLRNEVAIAIDKNNKAWGVENSGDDFRRTVNGVAVDIHEDNPAEELNLLGDPSVPNEKSYGYPICFTAWDGNVFQDSKPATGAQFIPAPNSTFNDATCEQLYVPPRLSIQAHSAPIDAKFDVSNTNLYVTLHGSWNRNVPTGFKVIQIPFKTDAQGEYEPVAARNSKTGYSDILWDTQSGCSSFKCLRPTGLSWDRDFTRMYIASDSSVEGELYLLAKV